MGKSVNKIMLLGNIGQPPETRTLKNGTLLTTVSLATNERFKQGDVWKDRVEWHSVLFYGKIAEIARDYLHKGSRCFIEGRNRTDSWEDDHQQKRWRTHVVASDLTLLDARENRPPQTPDAVLAANNYGYGTEAKTYNTTAPEVGDDEISDDDIPF